MTASTLRAELVTLGQQDLPFHLRDGSALDEDLRKMCTRYVTW